jgi:hypothetical protein
MVRLIKDRTHPEMNIVRMHSLFRFSMPAELQQSIRSFYQQQGDGLSKEPLKRLDRWLGIDSSRVMRSDVTGWVSSGRKCGQRVELDVNRRLQVACCLMRHDSRFLRAFASELTFLTVSLSISAACGANSVKFANLACWMQSEHLTKHCCLCWALMW